LSASGAVRSSCFQLAGQDRRYRVIAQLVVVDQILVAQRQAKHPPNQSSHLVLNQIRLSVVGETAGKTARSGRSSGQWRQQHGSRIRGHLATVKPGHHRPTRDRCKTKQIHATLCLHQASPDRETNRCCNTIFSDSAARCSYPFEKSGLADRS